MPRLMEKSDWMRTVENVSRGGAVWSETVNSRGGLDSLVFPESGAYQIIFVKLDDEPRRIEPKRKSARDMIGFGRRFHSEYRSTEDVMRELREGEE